MCAKLEHCHLTHAYQPNTTHTQDIPLAQRDPRVGATQKFQVAVLRRRQQSCKTALSDGSLLLRDLLLFNIKSKGSIQDKMMHYIQTKQRLLTALTRCSF